MLEVAKQHAPQGTTSAKDFNMQPGANLYVDRGRGLIRCLGANLRCALGRATPDHLIDDLLSLRPRNGCSSWRGTGIPSEQLLRKGVDVLAVALIGEWQKLQAITIGQLGVQDYDVEAEVQAMR
jgi:hypothetical protein